ncbi:MAG: hypothetical protein ACLUDU_14385 [Butyricimonas faecihominis]
MRCSGSCRADFFVALMLGYPVVYTFIYSNEVAREVPVAVVDHSKSALSPGVYPELGCHGECGRGGPL